MMTWSEVNHLSEIHGDSFFVFDEDKFRANFRDLNAAFNAIYPNTRIAYSYKTNYTPVICRIVDEMEGYAEVVSEMEYALAKRLGIDDNRIIYNGPYKSFESMRTALRGGAIINLDSRRDYDSLIAVAREFPQSEFAVGIRCNFSLDTGQVSRFGFDVEGAEFHQVVEDIFASSNIRLSGLHCHFPNRDLETFGIRARHMLKLAKQIFSAPPDFLDLGGGFFGSMPASLQKIYGRKLPRFQDYAELIGGLFSEAFGHSGKLPVLFIEPGTALVADTFKFYTKVISIKNIRGHSIATVAGSIFNINPVARSIDLPVTVLRQSSGAVPATNEQPYDIAGFTCIETDYLTKGLKKSIEIDDFLVYENVGSYSIVMKPPFILPNVPILKASQHSYTLIKRRETTDYIFQNFVI